MRNYPRLSCIYAILIIFIIILVNFGLVSAEGLPKSINLDITAPPQKKAEDQDDVILEKYKEVMEEISISEEAMEIAEQIKNMVAKLQDICMDILVTEIKGNRNDEMRFELSVSIVQQLARIEFQEPSALRGHIVVADQEKMETKMFRPVVNQITVQTLEDISKEALSALSIADLTSYFDFTRYEVVVLENKEIDGLCDYSLQVIGFEDQKWHVRVKSDTWVPYEIVVFEDDKLMGKLTLTNVVLDPGLESEELKDLPKVKEVRL